MKRLLLYCLFLSVALNSFAQQNKQIEKGQCLIFNGSIDKYPITLIFEVFNKEIQGRYYYHKIGVPIALHGSTNDSGYTLETVYGGKEEKETFTLRIFHNELFGKWEKNGKELSVNVIRTTNPIDMFRYHKKVEAREVLFNKGKSFETEKYYQEAELSFTFLWPNGANKQDVFTRKTQFQQLHRFQLGAENSSAIRFDEPVDPRTVNGHPAQLLHLMQRISDTFFAQFTTSVLDAHKANSTDYLTNQSLDITNNFHYDSEKYNVIETTQSEYTGGAHGMYFQYHNTWSKEKNQAVEIEQMLTKKQIKALPKAMTQSFKIAKGIPQKDPLDQHGYWIKEFDSEGGNTYFTDLGIHTTFGLYEIAPYSEGIVEVFVSWKNLK